LKFRRKLNVRGPASADPVVLEPAIMESIEKYIQCRDDIASCLVAKFLSMFLVNSPLLEAYEIDNFILRNGRILSKWSDFSVLFLSLSDVT
jgi:hypothetical protein